MGVGLPLLNEHEFVSRRNPSDECAHQPPQLAAAFPGRQPRCVVAAEHLLAMRAMLTAVLAATFSIGAADIGAKEYSQNTLLRDDTRWQAVRMEIAAGVTVFVDQEATLTGQCAPSGCPPPPPACAGAYGDGVCVCVVWRTFVASATRLLTHPRRRPRHTPSSSPTRGGRRLGCRSHPRCPRHHTVGNDGRPERGGPLHGYTRPAHLVP